MSQIKEATASIFYELPRKAEAVALAAAFLVSSLAFIEPAGAREDSSNFWPYAHAGKIDYAAAGSISATVTETRQPEISDGHVAGWIGLVDGSAGVQVGIERQTGQTQSQLYYEQTDEYGNTLFSKYLGKTSVGQPVRLKIENIGSDYWAVFINGHQQRPAVQTHGQLHPEFMAESSSQLCKPNKSSYSFSHLTVKPTRNNISAENLEPLKTGGYKLHLKSGSDFTAGSE